MVSQLCVRRCHRDTTHDPLKADYCDTQRRYYKTFPVPVPGPGPGPGPVPVKRVTDRVIQ